MNEEIVLEEGRVPYIVSIYKGKGRVLVGAEDRGFIWLAIQK